MTPLAYAVLATARYSPGLSVDELAALLGAPYEAVLSALGDHYRAGLVAYTDGARVTDAGVIALRHLGHVDRVVPEPSERNAHSEELVGIYETVVKAQREAEVRAAKREAAKLIKRIREAGREPARRRVKKTKTTTEQPQQRPDGWPWKLK